MAEDGFFSRWSRRKAQVQRGERLPEPPAPEKPAATPVPAPVAPAQPAPVAEAAPVEPPPTLEDVARLDRESDYARFVAPDVAPEVKNAALRKLFSDPHFNVMDGLDIYIDDYNKPDPLPPGMLRQLAQSKLLGLFDDEEGKNQGGTGAPEGAAAAAAGDAASQQPSPVAASMPVPALPDPAAEPPLTLTASHEDADLQLQPDHAAGRPGAGESAAPGGGPADRS